MTENILAARNELETALQRLHAQRMKLIDVDNSIKAVDEEIAKTELGQKRSEFLEVKNTTSLKLKENEADIRVTALEIAEELNDKKPAPGVTITKTTKVVIESEPTAIEWLSDKHPELLETKIRKGDFNRLMKAMRMTPEFVTVEVNEYGGVRIATNLEDAIYPDLPF